MGIIKNLGKWQNYVHYVLLAVGVYIWHSIPLNETVEQIYMNNQILAFPLLILWWTIGLFIIDTIVHLIFANLPKPLKWDD